MRDLYMDMVGTALVRGLNADNHARYGVTTLIPQIPLPSRSSLNDDLFHPKDRPIRSSL